MKYVIGAAILVFMVWLIWKFVAFGAKDDVHKCIHNPEDCMCCPHCGNCIWETRD